jgi:hypothetical protein
MLFLPILPFVRTHQDSPLVLGDNEVSAVPGLVFANLGLLVLLRDWFGLI